MSNDNLTTANDNNDNNDNNIHNTDLPQPGSCMSNPDHNMHKATLINNNNSEVNNNIKNNNNKNLPGQCSRLKPLSNFYCWI